MFLLANVQRTPLFLYTRVEDLFGIAINNLQNPSNYSPLTSKSRNYITFTKNSITLYLTDSRVLLHNKIATMITFLYPFHAFSSIRNSRQPIRNIRQPTRNIRRVCDNIRRPTRNIRRVCDNIRRPTRNIRRVCDNIRRLTRNIRRPCDHIRWGIFNIRRVMYNIRKVSTF